ncbi:Flagellar hook-associated protein 3 [compost metagenome]
MRLLQLSQEQALNGQYKTNITAAKNSLNSEEAILTSIGNVLQRVREIAVQAGNGAQDSSDKRALATELAQREDELLTLLNSRDANGKYLFSGSQGDMQPFVRNPDGTYSYQGDESQRQVQIASSTFLSISDSGKELFENIFNANRVKTDEVAGNTGTGRVSLGMVDDKLAYDRDFPASNPPSAGDGVGIHFLDMKNYVIYDPTATPDWSSYDPSFPPVWQLSSGSIDSNELTKDFIRYGGVSVILDGKPEAGDEFTINRNPDDEKRSLLNVVSDLRNALQNSSNSAEGNMAIRDATGVALSNLDAVSNQVLKVRGQIGARLNTIDSTETFIEDVSLVNTGVISDLQDLDYAEAISRLSMQSTILQAAQQSYVKVSGLSLFNFLG